MELWLVWIICDEAVNAASDAGIAIYNLSIREVGGSFWCDEGRFDELGGGFVAVRSMSTVADIIILSVG